MRAKARTILAMLLLGPVAGGCGAGTRPAPAASAPSAGGLTAAEMEEIFRERRAAERAQYTAADVAFMTGMIHHHAQALEMAGLVPVRTTDPSMRTLAARILNGQEAEIATMQTWLRERGEPVPEVHVMDGHVMVMTPGQTGHDMHASSSAGTLMPGMLTEAQLAELAAARGEPFERLFLELMIQHHRGAVTMVHELFGTGGAAQDGSVFKLASDVQADQRSEIARMERMLAAMQGDASS